MEIQTAMTKTNQEYLSKNWTATVNINQFKVAFKEGAWNHIKFGSGSSFQFNMVSTNSGIDPSSLVKADEDYDEWLDISLSSRTQFSWLDLRKLIDFMGHPFADPQIYSQPLNLKNEVIFK